MTTRFKGRRTEPKGKAGNNTPTAQGLLKAEEGKVSSASTASMIKFAPSASSAYRFLTTTTHTDAAL